MDAILVGKEFEQEVVNNKLDGLILDERQSISNIIQERKEGNIQKAHQNYLM